MNQEINNISENLSPTIDVPLDLLIEIRKLIEVSNSRINWKIEELLPVGIIINKLDKLLEKEKEKEKDNK